MYSYVHTYTFYIHNTIHYYTLLIPYHGHTIATFLDYHNVVLTLYNDQLQIATLKFVYLFITRLPKRLKHEVAQYIGIMFRMAAIIS